MATPMARPRGVAFLHGGDEGADPFGCRMEVDSAGTFELRRIPPGSYELRFPGLGGTQGERIPVHVGAETLIQLDLLHDLDLLIRDLVRNPERTNS